MLIDCFEVFGCDFIVDESLHVYLLEINQGPGLEGHCFPSVCQRIIDDTLTITLDSLLNAASLYTDDNSPGIYNIVSSYIFMYVLYMSVTCLLPTFKC